MAILFEEGDNTDIIPQSLPEETNRFGAAQSALTQESFIGNISAKSADFLGDMLFANTNRDTTFNPRDKIDELTESGLKGTAIKGIIDNANNEEYYYVLKQRALRDKSNAEALDNLGLEGVGYRVLAGLSDTAVTLGAFNTAPLATEKIVAGGAQVLQTVGMSQKASRVVTSMVGGMGVELGLETPKQINALDQRDEVDMLVSAFAGAVGGALYRPAFGAKLAGDSFTTAINGALEEADTIMQIEDPIVRSAKLKEAKHQTVANFMESLQFTKQARLTDTASETLTKLADELFDNPRVMTTDNYAASEVHELVKDQLNTLHTQGYTPLYNEWYQMTGQTIMGTSKGARFHTKAQEEFSNWLGDLYYGTADLSKVTPEFISKANKFHEDWATGAHEILSRQHQKFKDGIIPVDPSYLPREWKISKVWNDISNGTIKRSEYISLVAKGLKQGLEGQGKEITPELESIIAEKSKNWVSSQEAAAKMQDGGDFLNYIKTDLRVDSIHDVFNELLKHGDETLTKEDVGTMFNEALTKTEKTKAPAELSSRMKRRAEIDTTASITTEAGHNISLHDYLEKDISKIHDKYAVQMAGDSALTQLGIKSREDIARLRTKISDELDKIYGNTSEKYKDTLLHLDDTFKQFLGFPTASDPKGLAQQTVTQMNMFTRATMLGSVWLPALAEVTKVAHHLGARAFVKSMPDIIQFFKGYAGKETDRMMEMRSFIGLDSAYRNVVSSVYDDLHTLDTGVVATNRGRADKLTSFLNEGTKSKLMGAQEFTLQFGGAKSLQGLLETMLASGATTRILTNIAKGVELPDRIIKEYGWSRDTYNTIVKNINKYADKTGNAKKDLLNLAMWDTDAQTAYLLGIRRASSSVVQRSLIGDDIAFTFGNELIKNTAWGQLALSMKGYMLNAYSKQLSRGLYNFDSRIFGEWVAVTGAAYGISVAQAHISAAGDEDELEKQLAPDALIARTIANHSASSLLPVFMDAASRFIIDEPIISQTTRGSSSISPAYDKLKQVASIPSTITGLGLGGVTTTDKEIKNAIKSVVPNFFGVNYLATQTGKEFGEDPTDKEEESTYTTLAKGTALLGGAALGGSVGKKLYKAMKKGK